MAKKTSPTKTTITADRAARLFKLLSLLDGSARTRDAIQKKLRIDVRSFYRDVEYLRSLEIPIEIEGIRYSLTISLQDALSRLPFPDPGLSMRDVMLLSQGRTEAHRKLRERITLVVGSRGRASSI